MKTKNILLICTSIIGIVLFISCLEKEQPILEKPSEFHPIHFGAQLTFASGDMYVDITELKEQLKIIEETGVDIIRIDINYEAWMTNDLDNIKRHDNIIKQIRNDGKKLMLADRGATSFTKNKVTWEYFKQQHLKHTRIFMKRYKPDYYVVVKEPIWYTDFDPMIYTDTTPAMWYELALEACNIVEEINPETKCAVAVYPSGQQEKEFFALSANISNLDIMGVDCYSESDLMIVKNDLMPLVPKNIEIWMLESWNGGGSSYLQPWKKEEDAEWIKKSIYYSQINNFNGYIIYYPLHFSSYTKLRGIDWSQRTPAFYIYQEVIEEVNKKR